MTPACRRLFDYALSFVTRRDIEQFSLSDPGYPDYVREWTQILMSRQVPEQANFDIHEIIATTKSGYLPRDKDSGRYLRFCVFTNAVAAAISTGPGGPDESITLNYVAVELLDCGHALSDDTLLRILPDVFDEIHTKVRHTDWCSEEGPFFLLGRILLAYQGFDPGADTAHLAEMLIQEEAAASVRFATGFLWDTTAFTSHHDRWWRLVETCFPEKPAGESEALLNLKRKMTALFERGRPHRALRTG
jgi:hypothetical protein